MAYNAAGVWTPEDDSVTGKLNALTATDSPLMQQARTGAASYANKRGLLNSSIAAGAGEDAAIRAALPVASQEASQAAQKNLTAMNLGSSERVAQMNVASTDKRYLAAATADLQKTYAAAFDEVMKNNDLGANARNAYYQHLQALQDSDLSLLEQIYDVDLSWASTAATHVP